jgi:phosphoenolpyruvate synthase/pyruvate phosphate dikinase
VRFIPLADCRRQPPDLVGNKACNLSKLIEITREYCPNFEVPDGFVLDSSPTSFMPSAQVKLHTTLEKHGMDFLKLRTNDAWGRTRMEASKIMRKYIESRCRTKLEQIVADIMREIQEHQDWHYLYARSSANLGDTEDKTYASAFRSFPMVASGVDETKLLDCLIAIYKSLFSWEAMTQYLYNDEKDLSTVRMALIFQKLEDKTAAFSGLLHTKVDFSKSTNKRVWHIMAAQGLSERIMRFRMVQLMWGEAMADAIHRYEKNREVEISFEADIVKDDSMFSVRNKREKPQEHRVEVNLVDGWGTTVRRIPEEEFAQLPDDVIQRLAQIGEKVRGEFGTPLLIEWIVCNVSGKLLIQLVQARPMPIKARRYLL